MLIDDVKVGLSFAAVVGASTSVSPIPLTLKLLGGKAVLMWNDPAFVLQAAPAASGGYTNVPGAGSPYTNAITGPVKFFRLKAN